MDYGPLARLSSAKLAPDNWSLVVADVRGSTRAIHEGRYREVNLVGAACIAAIRNKYSSSEVPYVFGGDGATFLIPDYHLANCLKLLDGVKAIAGNVLKLDLMIGHMAVREIREKGREIYYGHIAGGPTEQQSFFRGDGVRFGEKAIKDKARELAVVVTPPTDETDLNGLSCRLLPFHSARGQVMSVVIDVMRKGREEDDFLSTILRHLSAGGDLDRLRPVSLENQRRPWLSDKWKTEALLQTGKNQNLLVAYIKTFCSYLLGNVFFRMNLRNPVLGVPSEYTQLMFEQSDWIKMDGTLQLVLDMTAAEIEGFLKFLRELEASDDIRFGYHISEGTVMTCHFQSVVGHRHTHFIDGTGGGLTHAANQLKTKLA